RVVAGSEFAASALNCDPEALAWLSRNTAPADAQQANNEYERRTASATSGAEAQRLLRAWRRREMLRIAWCEIAGRASVADTLRSLSELADGCVRAAVAAAQTHLQTPF